MDAVIRPDLAPPNGPDSPPQRVAMPIPRRACALANVIRTMNTVHEEIIYIDQSLVPVHSSPEQLTLCGDEKPYPCISVKRPHAYSI